MSLIDETIARIRPLDAEAIAAATARQLDLTKPPGSLGPLEDVSIQLCGIAGTCPAPVPEPATVVVFAADHGVQKHAVSPWPQEVTAQMVANFLAGGAVINVLSRHAGARVEVVDVGIATPVPPVPSEATLLTRTVRPGTADLSSEPAMTLEEARRAVEVGIEVAQEAIAGGARCLLMGDMGIGNTTASAALIAAFTGAGADEVTGRGSGLAPEAVRRKAALVAQALDLHRPSASDGLATVAAIGGLEHAAMAGMLLAGAAAGIPVIVDGVIADAGALVAQALCPESISYAIAGHRSAEPAAALALERLGLRPLLSLDLCLGEGSGAVLALPIVQAAAKVLAEVATFSSAGVSDAGVPKD